jgi:hypothetical protein
MSGPDVRRGSNRFYLLTLMQMVPSLPRMRSGAFPALPAMALCLFAMLALRAPARAAEFTINGTIRLNTIAPAISPTGDNHIRFSGKGYETPGSLSLVNNGSNSLVFERDAPSDAVLLIDDILLHLQGQKGTVIFRGLALKFRNGGALFDSNQSGNHNLRFDSCTVLGDTATLGKVFSWGGDGSSELSIRNSQFAYTGSISLTGASSIKVENSMFVATGPITLSSLPVSGPGTVSLMNNLFSGAGVLSATVKSRLEMGFNTANQTQFLLDGNFSANCDIRNNYFAHPPTRNALPQGGSQRYATFFKGGSFIDSGTTVSENVRDSAWDGFEYSPPGGTTVFSDPSNTAVRTPKGPGTIWDWKIPGDVSHGAWSGTNPLPDFNLYPPAASVTLPLRGGQAEFQLLPSSFPRRIVPVFGIAAYASSLPDSIRSWFPKDTTLVLTGDPATVLALRLPAQADSGTPLLFARTDAGYKPLEWNASGDGAIKNSLPEAREFIPVLGGQNVSRGTGIIVRGPPPVNPLLRLPAVTRAGIMVFKDPQGAPSEKRIRRIRSDAQDIAFNFTTNAEGFDTFRFEIPKANLSVPYLPDSLFFWLGGNTFVGAKDSLAMYWGQTALHDTNNTVMLVERLSLAPGPDTLKLGKATVIAWTTAGHQVLIDSSYRPARTDFPDMGAFGAAYAFSWPGRVSRDSFSVVLPRTDPLQNAYALIGSKAEPLKPSAVTANSLRISFGIGDNDKVVFIARRFMIPAGTATDLALGDDSVKGLLSATPGDFRLEPSYKPVGLDTTRLHPLAARRIIMDSLSPRGNYLLLLKAPAPSHRDSLHAFVLKDTGWKTATVLDSGGRYAVQVDSAVQAVVLAEGLKKEDLTPVQPVAPAAIQVEGDVLTIKPNLTASEKAMYDSYRIDLVSLDADGKARTETGAYADVDAATSLALAGNRLYAYRVVYRSPVIRFSPDSAWIPLEGKQPAAESLQASIPERAALHQHLIGFPFEATLSVNVQAGFEGGMAKKQSLLGLKPDGTWEPKSTDGKTKLNRGEGYLFAADKRFNLKVGPSAYRGLRPDTLPLPDSGWHLLSNPYPIRLPVRAIQFDSSYSLPQRLKRTQPSGTLKAASYNWEGLEMKDVLSPFEGFLIYSFRPTRIVFNPMAAIAAAPKATASLNGTGGGSDQETGRGTGGASQIRLTLATPWGTQTAVLYRTGPYLPTPYMPPWSEAGEVPSFRVGGGRGWAFRKFDRLDSLVAEIEITAPEKGIYSLAVASQDEDTGPIRLLDWQTGAILDEAGMGSLALAKGASRFTLLRGKAVDPGTDAFTRMLPSDFVLAQNYPNPFLGSTRIRIGIPAGAGRVLASRIRVLAMDGRIVADRPLGALAVGSHLLTLGSDAWRPGIYIYELGIRTDRGAIRLQKKMAYGAVAR